MAWIVALIGAYVLPQPDELGRGVHPLLSTIDACLDLLLRAVNKDTGVATIDANSTITRAASSLSF
jgi:hypothetical protein